MATPAAVLSILVKAQGVSAASAQLTTLDKSGKRAAVGIGAAEDKAKRSTKTFSALGSTAKMVGGVAGVAGLAAAGRLVAEEFREAQKVGSQTSAVLKSTGNAAKTTRKDIESLSATISSKSGIDDEAIQKGANLLLTFKSIRNETGRGNQIFNQATQVITDMSVAMDQGLKPSAIQVGKALNDPVKGMTALTRVGVQFTASQTAQVNALVKSGDKLGAQKIILAELQSQFGGSAAAQATAADKFRVAIGNLAEAAGVLLMPVVQRVAIALTAFMNGMLQGTGAGGQLVAVLRTMGVVLGTVVGLLSPTAWLVLAGVIGTVSVAVFGVGVATKVYTAATVALTAAQWLLNAALTANPIGLVVVALTALGVALVVAYKRSETFRNIVNGAFAAVRSVAGGYINGLVGVVRTAWSVITTITRTFIAAFTGDFRTAWTNIKSIFTGGFSALKSIIAGAAGALGAAARAIGTAIVNGIVGAIKAAGSKIVDSIKGVVDSAKGAVSGAFDAINPFGDGPGRGTGPAGIGVKPIVPLKGGGNLMGAKPTLGPFAAIGARNGLRVSSGKRNGGGTSHHNSGNAVDLAGPAAGMMKTFRTLRSSYGGRLAELIYTPGGVGIKNGKPYTYTGAIAADHFDHVHVAYTGGVGDGPGRALGAASRAGAFMGDGPGGGNPKKIWQFLLANGFTPAQAAGILGNLRQESGAGMDPNAREAGGKGPGHGIAQWSFGRATALKAFAKKHGKPWNDLGVQLAFMMSEFRGPENAAYKAVKSAKSVSAAESAFGLKYERYGIMGNRSGQQYYNQFKNVKGTITEDMPGWDPKTMGNKRGSLTAPAKITKYQEQLAAADLGIAESERGSDKLKQAAAITAKRKVIGAEIRRIKKALKRSKKMTPAKRLDLTQRLSSLLGEHTQLGKTGQELRHPTVETGLGGEGGDPNQALIDSNAALQAKIEESVAAQREHQAAVDALKAEIKAQNAIAGSTIGISLREAQRALADVISGQIGGYGGVGGRAFTAGAGNVARY